METEKEAQSYDFDLPEVEATKVTKPRVHVTDSACISCEG